MRSAPHPSHGPATLMANGMPLRRRDMIAAGAGLLLPSAALASPPGAVYHDFWHAPRSITLYRAETGEGGEFEYWRDGRLQMRPWMTILRLMRDVRAGVGMHYDRRVVDIVWAVQEWARRDTGKTYLYRLTDGARTERTNRMIPGASPESEHKFGRALDGRFERMSLGSYAQMAKFFGMGGVGVYSTHIHVDCGLVRTWQV